MGVVTDLSVTAKLSLLSGHIFCVFILIREVSSSHYPTTPFKSSVLWHSLILGWKKKKLKAYYSDVSLPTLLPEIACFKPLAWEEPFAVKRKHLASKDCSSNYFQDFMGTGR